MRTGLASVVVSSLILCALVAGCINNRSERGVEALWEAPGHDAFVVGRTTRAEVLDELGPPSQIVTLGEGSAYYYLLEKTHARGLILLLYNSRNEKTVYERAVFFFDRNGVLTDYATR